MDIFKRQWPMFTDKEKKEIRNMKVFVAGAGGLGTHQMVQLQRIGVKRIHVIDCDVVEASNLNRQILYGKNDIGRSKVAVSGEKLDEFSLETEVNTIEGEITEELEIPREIDVILDALDNYPTRLVLDRLAHRYDKPLVHGAVDSWHGQLTSIVPGETPALEDIVGPEAAKSNDGNEGPIPVFSPVVSSVAVLQVLEAVKLHLGRDNTLAGRLLFLDWKNYTLDKIDLR